MDGVKKESMLQQASQIWTMLDDMALSNPQGYKKFIDQKMKEREEYFAPPEPHMCVQTFIQGPESKKIYINFFSWTRISAPNSDTSPVPVVGGKIEKIKEKTGSPVIATVAMNPQPLEECCEVTSQTEYTQTLIQLAMAFVEKQNKVFLSKTFCILSKNDSYKGNLTNLRKGLLKIFAKDDEVLEKDIEDIEKKLGPAASGAKDSLLEQMSNIMIDKNNLGKVSDHAPQIKLIPEQKPSKKVMIEDITARKVLTVPKYDMNVTDSGDKRNIVVKIYLPLVQSVEECELDISEDDFKLLVTDKYELHVTLPEHIVDSEASAKFNRNVSAMTLRMPVR